MPWQAQVLNVGLELLPDGRPAYREVRVKVPRQSGKTTLQLLLEVDRCLYWGRQQRCLYAAQDRNSSRLKWEEQADFLLASPLAEAFDVRRQTGLERIIVPSTGSSIGITASGETSGHGGTLALAMIDEAWAQRDERLMQAFRPAMMTLPKAQLWVMSTEGTDESHFLNDRVDDGRARVEAGNRNAVAYFEWSAGDDDDPDDPQTWLGCMPALGITVDVATVQADHDAMDPAEFARAYLNRRAPAGATVIPAALWQACGDPRSQLGGMPRFALDVTPDRSAAAIGVAGWRSDRRRHVEIVDHRGDTDWVVARLAELYARWAPWPVVVDPVGPAGSLLVELEAAGVKTDTVGARDLVAACGQFFDAVKAQQVVHLDQPILNVAVQSARKRTLGDAWAWARKTGGDISPLVAVTLANWGLVKAGTGNFQIL